MASGINWSRAFSKAPWMSPEEVLFVDSAMAGAGPGRAVEFREVAGGGGSEVSPGSLASSVAAGERLAVDGPVCGRKNKPRPGSQADADAAMNMNGTMAWRMRMGKVRPALRIKDGPDAKAVLGGFPDGSEGDKPEWHGNRTESASNNCPS